MTRNFSVFLAMFFLIATSTIVHANTNERLVQLIDYIGVDYFEAIRNGKVINENEYTEMLEFGATIEALSMTLEGGSKIALLRAQAGQLKQLIIDKAPTTDIQSLTRQMRSNALASLNLKAVPDQTPDLAQGETEYNKACAACHGANGRGEGPLSHGLDPLPTDFTDIKRFELRSLYALFNTITYGVDGTGMGSFSALSREDRWSLAAYVGQIAVDEKTVIAGQKAWDEGRGDNASFDINAYATLSPSEAAEKWRDGYELVAYLRTKPQALFEFMPSPLDLAVGKIEESSSAYADGRTETAYELALTAYLDGFELIEANLTATDSDLMRRIEREMLQYRRDIQEGNPFEVVQKRALTLQSLLRLAQNKLNEKEGLTPEAAFISSFVILLREGLEALLVIAAISALLVKSDRRDAMPYLHLGWVTALILGAVTWLVSDRLLQISGATREITEGIAALAASGMLLFVGYWLHSKTSATGWQAFIQKNLQSALGGRTLWGLAGLSFISVYREVFETILFYQALWAQAASGNTTLWITVGFFGGLFVLAIVAWAILRFSVQLPIGKFFGATGILLLMLSIVFAGKGMAALHEAGKIRSSSLDFDAIEWIGIFPIWEGLVVQVIILSLAVIVYARDILSRKG